MAWAEAHAHGRFGRARSTLAARLTRARTGSSASARRPSPGRPARYSTAELVALERAALALVERGRDARTPRRSVCSSSKRSSGRTGSSSRRSRSGWSARSRRARTASCASSGWPGAGKTTATHAVAQVFAHAGIHVLGAAPSGVAAEKLQDETGIPSATLHRLLEHACRRAACRTRCVLVVDEAAMAETRVLAPVLEPRRAGRGEGDPDRRPAAAPRRRRRRALRRHRRARRRRRALREPPPARRARTRRARPRPRRRRPRLPRLRREARAARRLREPRDHARAASRRLVGARPRRSCPATSCSRFAAATSPTSTSSPAG